MLFFPLWPLMEAAVVNPVFSQVRLRLVKSCLIAVHSKDKNAKIKKANINQCDTKCTQVFFFTKRRKSLNIAESFHHNFIIFIATAAIFVLFPCFIQFARIVIHEADEHVQDSITIIDWRVSAGSTVSKPKFSCWAWGRYFDGVEKFKACESFGQ